MERGAATMDGEVSIEVPPGQLFRLWRDVSNLPEVLSHVDAVERLGECRSRWTVRGSGESPLVWEVEADQEIENERVGWHSVPDAPISSRLVVTFTPRDDGASTDLRVEVRYEPAERGGTLDVGRALGGGLQCLGDDLARLKRRIEAGDRIGRDSVEEASVQSFPASDPPAWTTRTE